MEDQSVVVVRQKDERNRGTPAPPCKKNSHRICTNLRSDLGRKWVGSNPPMASPLGPRNSRLHFGGDPGHKRDYLIFTVIISADSQ